MDGLKRHAVSTSKDDDEEGNNDGGEGCAYVIVT
jgi:hypothetical protein